MLNEESFIAGLAEKGVSFQVSHDSPYGSKSIPLPAEEVVCYARNPVEYIAKFYGVTRLQYLAWHESSYCVVCSDTTVEDKPCRNVIKGGHAIDSPSRWLSLQGGYCHVHENGTVR